MICEEKHIPRIYRKSLLPAALALLAASGLGAQSRFWDEGAPALLAESIVATMTDEEMVGQVLMYGYNGTIPSKAILDWIENRYIGGVKIFGWNADNIPDMVQGISRMQTAASRTRLAVPLFVATDQEGGWVRHVKGSTSITAGNMAIGASAFPFDGYFSGFYIGRELKAMGINMNFAPTVDVYLNPEAHVIGPRAFSDDPVKTASLAVAYYHGMKDVGIICTAKHFPGHGNTDQDSHIGLPRILSSLDTLWKTELVPYRFLIKEGLPAVMSGHIAYPEITGDDAPASLSEKLLTALLREKMGFGGIIITDDLKMEGVNGAGLDDGQIAVKALSAGNDMIMVSRGTETHEAIWKALLAEYRKNEDFKKSITASVTRILSTKLEYLKGPNAVPLNPDAARLPDTVPDKQGKGYFFDLACRSVTVIRDGKIPLSGNKGNRVLLVGQFDEFFSAGKEKLPGADTVSVTYQPFYSADFSEIQQVRKKAAGYDTVIFCLANPRSLQFLKGLKDLGDRVIVLSVLTPVYLREAPWVGSALALFGTGIESFQAGFAALLGDYKPEGTMPFSLPAIK